MGCSCCSTVFSNIRHPEWADAGCPGRLVSPPEGDFAALTGRAVACVVDSGLTEVPAGTYRITVWTGSDSVSDLFLVG